MKRVRSVEHDAGYGWIARNPATGEEILANFRWASRSVARTVVLESTLKLRALTPTQPEPTGGQSDE